MEDKKNYCKYCGLEINKDDEYCNDECDDNYLQFGIMS